MQFRWAVTIAVEDAACVASLRLVPGIEIGEQLNEVWLRGQPGDQQLQARLLCLPAVRRYEWLGDDKLRPVDRRIPAERMPNLRWQSLQAWLQVASPVGALPGNKPRPAALTLARSADEREPELLLTSLAEFREFAANAAEVRLSRLQFSASDRGEVLVRGRPLPPLPGRRFVLHGCVAVPAGFFWTPPVSAEVLARCFAASLDTLVLWNENNTISRLHAEQFVPASRSASQATQKALEVSV